MEYSQDDYMRERAICDKAEAYASAVRATRGPHCNYITREEAAHPDYAACDNAMRGRVQRYELLRDKPDRLSCYISSDGRSVTTWTGDILGTCRETSRWRVKSYIGSHMYQYRARIGGRDYTGRGFGAGMFINLRAVKS